MTSEERWSVLRRAWHLTRWEFDVLDFSTEVDGFYYAPLRLARKLKREGLLEENPQHPGCFRTTSKGFLVLSDYVWFRKERLKS